MIFREEGMLALWRGVGAGLQRQVIFAGLRIGLYPYVTNFFVGENKKPTLRKRIYAGLITGCFGIIIASPCDVVKVKLQASNFQSTTYYKNTLDTYSQIFKKEGLKGFYAGLLPNIIRCSIMNSAELAFYDEIKSYFMENFHISKDNRLLHFLCAIKASFLACIITSPVDVIKTQMMNVIIF